MRVANGACNMTTAVALEQNIFREFLGLSGVVMSLILECFYSTICNITFKQGGWCDFADCGFKPNILADC